VWLFRIAALLCNVFRTILHFPDVGERERCHNLSWGLNVLDRWITLRWSPSGSRHSVEHGNQWRFHHSYLGTWRMMVLHMELGVIRLVLNVTIEKRGILPGHTVRMVWDFSDSQMAIRPAAHQEQGPEQWSARQIQSGVQALLAHGITAKIHCVPGHYGIAGNDEVGCQATLAQQACGAAVIEQPYTSASNQARLICMGLLAAKAKLEANKCSKHLTYRLKGKTETKRPVLMTSMKSLATRFYRLQCGHTPTGVYLKWFRHQEDDKCLWCGGAAAQMHEHLFCLCSQWGVQQNALWMAVEKVTGWKAGRCQHIQVSELFSMKECD